MSGVPLIREDYVLLVNTGQTVHNQEKRLMFYEFLSYDFSLVPLEPNTKKCIEEGWQKYCLEHRKFKREEFAGKNAGVACGTASKIIVIDVDDPEGTQRWIKERGLSPFPENTFTVKTNRGYHLYFSYPDNNIKYPGKTIKENKKTLFEIKSIGAYVVAPGSVHPDTGKAYTIEKNIRILPAQGWFLDLSLNPTKYKINDFETYDSTDEIIKNPEEILPGNPGTIDINSLLIPIETKKKILESYPKGSRSEAEMSVIERLMRANVQESIIIKIFEEYPIGEKHREYGDGRFKRMEMQIQKAKEYLNLKTTQEANVFSFKTIGQIRKSNKKMNFIIEPVLAERDTLILLGKGGVGKSLFLLDMLITLAMPAENKFLGFNRTDKQIKTLIFQSENSESCICERFSEMFKDVELPREVEENIIFVSENDDILVNGNIYNDRFYKKVVGSIELLRPDIVVFDPLISFYEGDENHNNGMRKVLDTIGKITREHNVAVIVIHHDGKAANGSGSGGRGASAIGDWTANSIKLTETSEKDVLQLEHAKCRYRRKFEPINIFRNESLHFEVVKSGQNSSAISNSDLIVEALVNLGKTITVKTQLVNEVKRILVEKGQETKSHNTIIKMLNDAVQHGCVVYDGKSYSVI